MNELDDIEDSEIEGLKKDEDLDVDEREANYEPSAGNTNEAKTKKSLLIALSAFIVIAWFTCPIWLSALLEWISDSLDGPLKTFLLVAISATFILFLVMYGPSRYGEKAPLKRLIYFVIYIALILVGIVILAISS